MHPFQDFVHLGQRRLGLRHLLLHLLNLVLLASVQPGRLALHHVLRGFVVHLALQRRQHVLRVLLADLLVEALVLALVRLGNEVSVLLVLALDELHAAVHGARRSHVNVHPLLAVDGGLVRHALILQRLRVNLLHLRLRVDGLVALGPALASKFCTRAKRVKRVLDLGVRFGDGAVLMCVVLLLLHALLHLARVRRLHHELHQRGGLLKRASPLEQSAQLLENLRLADLPGGVVVYDVEKDGGHDHAHGELRVRLGHAHLLHDDGIVEGALVFQAVPGNQHADGARQPKHHDGVGQSLHQVLGGEGVNLARAFKGDHRPSSHPRHGDGPLVGEELERLHRLVAHLPPYFRAQAENADGGGGFQPLPKLPVPLVLHSGRLAVVVVVELHVELQS
mmetsp:Transcript_487/g.1020  ORF Transcript_487/g.1020 Transcript_487/m.1020 type:complete len:393 (-) Transcript_487:1121-2299(-)